MTDTLAELAKSFGMRAVPQPPTSLAGITTGSDTPLTIGELRGALVQVDRDDRVACGFDRFIGSHTPGNPASGVRLHARSDVAVGAMVTELTRIQAAFGWTDTAPVWVENDNGPQAVTGFSA